MRYLGEILFLNSANFFLELFLFMLICFINIKRRDHFYFRLLTCGILGLLFYFLPSLNVGGFSFAYTIILNKFYYAIYACSLFMGFTTSHLEYMLITFG